MAYLFFSQSTVIESFAVYSRLSWHLWFLSVWKMSIQNFLAFRVSIEDLSVILISLPLYVTWPLTFAALNIPFYYIYTYIFSVLLCDKGIFLVQFICYSVSFLNLHRHGWESFWFCWIYFLCIWAGVLLLLLYLLFLAFEFSWYPRFPGCFIPECF